MFDLYLSLEQEKREKQELERIEEQINNSSPPVTEQYSGGWVDGYINDKPRCPENWEYWSGYSQGNREYWCQQKGIELPSDF